LNKKPELSVLEKEEAEVLAALEIEEQLLKEKKASLLKAGQKRKSSPPSKTGSSSSETASSSPPSKTGSSSSKIPKKPKPIKELEFLQRFDLKDEFSTVGLKVSITGLGSSLASASILCPFFQQFQSTMEDVPEEANLLTVIQKAIKQFNERAKNDATIVISEDTQATMKKISKRGTSKNADRADKIAVLATKQIDKVLSCLTFHDRNHENKKSPVEVEDKHEDDDDDDDDDKDDDPDFKDGEVECSDDEVIYSDDSEEELGEENKGEKDDKVEDGGEKSKDNNNQDNNHVNPSRWIDT
jgi:hypothetical protein